MTFRRSPSVFRPLETFVLVLLVSSTLVEAGHSRQGWPAATAGQSGELDITNGIQTYSTLMDTTVNMTGRSELHVTDGDNPIPGCLINLNSSDAWFFLENIPPSLAMANYLGQIQINGAAAVVGGNVRVVEYAMGTVVIPHSPDYTPMQIFGGTQFTGDSMPLGLYIYYRGADLGTLYNAVSSFTLKRGYMATVAQRPDGTGISRVYVALDGQKGLGRRTAAARESGVEL